MNKFHKLGLVAILVIAIIGAYQFPKIQTRVERVVGSVAGPDFYYDYFGVNDVRVHPTRKSLTLATTTVCAIKSPSATSTLVHSSVKVTVASSTATTWTFAKATTGFATTTRLNSFSLGSGVQGTMVGTSTPTGVTAVTDDTNVFAPNNYFVVGVAGVAPAGTGLGGVCQATFVEI